MVFVCGLNHKTAPLSVREACVFSPSGLHEPLQTLIAAGEHQEAAILSTCNRTEIYCAGGKAANMLTWLKAHPACRDLPLDTYTYAYRDSAAVRHILRVASGLDSMVLGEPQILGQLKQAYQLADEAGTVGTALNRLFQYVFAVTKRVRTRTGIGQHPISIAYAAIQLAKQTFTALPTRRVLLVGAGQTIELVARYLHGLGVSQLTIASRDVIKATKVAKRFGGHGVCLGAISYHLPETDMVICATNAGKVLIEAKTLRDARCDNNQKPLLLIDLAVPRNISPDCQALKNTFLYTVDDLKSIISHNVSERQGAAKQAEALIELHADAFMATLRSLDAVSTICTYRHKMQATRQALVAKAQQRIAKGENINDVLEALTLRLSNILLHAPTKLMRELGEQGDWEMLDTLQHCFALTKTENENIT